MYPEVKNFNMSECFHISVCGCIPIQRLLNFFSQLLVLINAFLFILNFRVDILFLGDIWFLGESKYSAVTTFKVQWLLIEIYWKRVRQIDNRTDQFQICFFPLLSSLLFRTLLCNSTITQKGNRSYLPLQIKRHEIRG